MDKKETNSFIFEGEDIRSSDFLEPDNDEDKKDINQLNSLLNSPKKIEDDDEIKNLNNKTSVSDTDKVYIGEVNEEIKKSKDNDDSVNDLNQTSLTNKNEEEDEDKDDNDLNENMLNSSKNEIELVNVEKNICQSRPENEKSKKDSQAKNDKKEKTKIKKKIFNIRKIQKRSKKIQLLRRKKGILLHRKIDSDIMMKKVKIHFMNHLIDEINSKIYSHTKLINKKKKFSKFLKFNYAFTSNVSKLKNRILLDKKIKEILMEVEISSKYRTYDINNNYNLTKYLLSINSEHFKILNSTFKDCYKEFLQSPHYKEFLKFEKQREGEQYYKKIKFVSENFINYFMNNPKKEPKKKNFTKIFVKDKNQSNREEKNHYFDNSNIYNRSSFISNGFSLLDNFHEFSDLASFKGNKSISIISNEIDYRNKMFNMKISYEKMEDMNKEHFFSIKEEIEKGKFINEEYFSSSIDEIKKDSTISRTYESSEVKRMYSNKY